MKREFSAGGVVFKNTNSVILWLIIKPRPSKEFPQDRYQLPKGHIDPDENPETTAIREVREETGIKSSVIKKVGDIKYTFSMNDEKIFKIVSWYLMEYQSGNHAPDHIETEEVLWLPFSQAKKTLTFSSEKSILQKASEMIKSN